MWIVAIWILTGQGDQPTVKQPQQQSATITYGDDREIRVDISGRSGNLELTTAEGEIGEAAVDFQRGSGFVSYDRKEQKLVWVSKKRYSLNHLSKSIIRKAPYMRMSLPPHCELDFGLTLVDLGFGTLDFRDINIKKMALDVNYGDIDLSFPTENKSIIREPVLIHLRFGDLEIYDLGNLKASQVTINAGIGEVNVDFGPKVTIDTDVRFDHDIGTSTFVIPKGTFVVIQGTSRNFDEFGMVQDGKVWKTNDHTSEFPMLTIEVHGPMGDLNIVWE